MVLTTRTNHLVGIFPALLAATMLVAGQWLFERVMRQQSALPAVVEFAGGLVFLFLLLKGRLR